MDRVAILYSTKSGEKEEAILSLAGAFQKLKYRVSVKKAGEAAITDVLAAEIVVLGSGSDGPIDPAFGEIHRALNGVNLAGRIAGILDFDNGSGAAFRESLKDTDIDIFTDRLQMGKAGVKEINNWASGLNKQYREIARAGKL